MSGGVTKGLLTFEALSRDPCRQGKSFPLLAPNLIYCLQQLSSFISLKYKYFQDILATGGKSSSE